MSSLDLTREWLQTVLRPYASRERIVSEVMDILASRRTLSVKTDAFTYDTGQTALLLLLHGTLPINYRGATYQIPLHVWVPHDYPRNPPLAFVVPTKEMGVRKGREVEPGGRVKDEVVQSWWAGWEPKGIDVLLRHLSGIFSATPPVFARPPETVSSPARPAGASSGGMSPQYMNGQSAIAGPSQQQPPPPPSRPNFQPPPQHSHPGQGPSTEYLPQYDPAQTPPPHPYPHQDHTRQASGSYPHNNGNGNPPGSPHNGVPPIPYRPQIGIPPRQGSLPPSSPSGSEGPGPTLPQRPYNPVQAQGVPPRPMSVGYGPPPGQMGQMNRYVSPLPGSPGGSGQYQSMPYSSGGGVPQTQMGYPPNGYNSQTPQSYTGPPQQVQYNPPYSSAPQNGPRPPQPAPQPAPALPQQAQRRAPAPDLMSSFDGSPTLSPTGPNTAPPPVPPSKPPPPSTMHLHSILLPHLTASLPPLLSSLHASRTHLLERKDDLTSGEPAIRDEMARLEAVLKVCEATAGKLGEVVAKGQSRVGDLDARGEVSVDEVVCGISIVHNQLIDLVAEDNAIDDTIYHITRAFEAERLDLDRFLKSIRSLAREQYMKRALIERILQGMGQKQGW